MIGRATTKARASRAGAMDKAWCGLPAPLFCSRILLFVLTLAV